MSVRTEVQVGSEFVGYRIDELLGRGGMGVVYGAYDLRLKRTVALKLIAPELALDPRFRERFIQETEVAMSLEHPNVVPIHDAGDIDGRLYLAMRRVEGSDLRTLLRRERALDGARALAVCRQIASALDAAHAKGLVHRDVKPSNVLLDASEHVYLADFGLTRRLEEQEGATGGGRSVGTPAYLAPEQIEGRPVDGRTDVYSLGCLLFECLTGEPPFARGSRLEVAWAHLEEEPPGASERRPELPHAIDAVIRKAMAKEPEDRHPTCAALIGEAEDALGLRRTPPLLKWRIAVIGVAAFLAIAAVLVAVALLRNTGTAAVPPVTADTLVRISPVTNKIDAVARVGATPAATAVGGERVWLYRDSPSSVSEIDAATRTVGHTITVPAPPTSPDVFTGPVLAADAGGAWAVGVDTHGRPSLTRVFAGLRGKRAYPLRSEPRAVAVGYGAVWVVVNGARDNRLLRIDPATGKVEKQTRFPRSAQIDGLAVGLGNVWVVASSTATLYRINPHSARRTGQVVLGEHASRPALILGQIWVGLRDSGYDTSIVDPRTLIVVGRVGGNSNEGSVTAADGSIWSYDPPTGTVERWDGQTHEALVNIRIASPPYYSGLCLTSIAAGAGAVWVTVAAAPSYSC